MGELVAVGKALEIALKMLAVSENAFVNNDDDHVFHIMTDCTFCCDVMTTMLTPRSSEHIIDKMQVFAVHQKQETMRRIHTPCVRVW